MRRPTSVLASAFLGTALVSSTVFVSVSAEPPPVSQAAPPPTNGGDPTASITATSRSPRTLLRNGLDYITYQEYDRALAFLREADARKGELTDAERLKLKQGIDRALRGIREASVGIANEAPYARSGRKPRPGSIALATPPAEREAIQLASATMPDPQNPNAANVRATGEEAGPGPGLPLPAMTSLPNPMPSPVDPPPLGGDPVPALAPAVEPPPIAAPSPAPLTPDPVPTTPSPSPRTAPAPTPGPTPLPPAVEPAAPAAPVGPSASPTPVPEDGPLPTLPTELVAEAPAGDPKPAPAPPVPPRTAPEPPPAAEAPPANAPAPSPVPSPAPEPAPVPAPEVKPAPTPEVETLPTLPEAIASPSADPAAPAPVPVPATTPAPEPVPAPAATDPSPVPTPAPVTIPASELPVMPATIPEPSSTGAPPTVPDLPPAAEAPPVSMPAAAAAAPATRPTSEIPISEREDTFIPHRAATTTSTLTPELQREVARQARLQDEKMKRDGQRTPGVDVGGGDQPATPGGTMDTSRLVISRAPSPTEARPLRAIPVPEEFVPLPKREWEPNRKYWAAAATCHYPLYFQDAALERYGYTMEQRFGPAGRFLTYPIDDVKQSKQRNQLVQPFFSAGLFAAQIVLLPYHMLVDVPWESEYDLGYYRPGDRVPADVFYLPLFGVGPPLQGNNYYGVAPSASRW